MSDQISYNLDLMEQLRLAAAKASGRLGTVGDDVGAISVDASIFGRGDGAGAVAAALDGAKQTAQRQFTQAESLLHGVSRAVDQVMAAIEAADQAGQQSFGAGRNQLG